MIPRGHALYVDVEDHREALDALAAIHVELDVRLKKTTGNLALPCYEPRDGCAHCNRCCHESVFLTPLEWFGVVDHMQRHFSPEELTARAEKAIALYHQHRAIIDGFMSPPQGGAKDHFATAQHLKFTCPLLGPDGCTVYAAREILGRVFGQSFNDEGGIYGCDLSGKFFQGEFTLVRATAWAKRIQALPLTGYRQVYPWYFAKTYDTSPTDGVPSTR